MRKTFGLISGVLSPLFFTTAAFAVTQVPSTNIPLSRPPGAIEDIPLANIPQFIITLLFVIGIIAALVFLIYGGIRWVISGGDKSAVENARNTIVAAIIGLVIIAGAFFIITVVFQLLGLSSPLGGKFCIPNVTSPTCT